MATNEKSSAVLTDAEIKKALEYCIWNDGCEQCPISEKCFFFYNKPYAETPEILRLSLDLINRLEADKEALIAGQETLQKSLAEKNAEIEKLKNECFGLRIQCIAMKDCIVTLAEETIQEFAERLCEGRASNDPVVIAVKAELKEMVGDAE